LDTKSKFEKDKKNRRRGRAAGSIKESEDGCGVIGHANDYSGKHFDSIGSW
jgi:hypothetical protein